MDSSQVSRMMQMYIYQNMFSSMGSSSTGNSGSGSYASLFQALMAQALTQYLEKEGLKTNSATTANVVNSSEASNSESNTQNNNSNTNQNINNVLNTEQSNIDKAIESASKKYGIDEALIRAVIKQESSFNTYAVSSAGAQGLMQLMPSTATSLGVENPFNALDNINGGTRYLKSLMEAFNGNKELALAAYNGGIGRMNRLGVDTTAEISKMPMETRQYVAKVISNYNKYKNV